MAEHIEVWNRQFARPRINLIRPARPHPFAVWNRYGAVPGTPNHGVTIGFAVMLRGRGISVRWARPLVHIEEISAAARTPGDAEEATDGN
jgi:hypothetical protein